MGGFSLWHWLVVGVIILLLFGKGRFSEMMGDVAKGLKSFKKGMTEDEEVNPPPRRIEGDHTTGTGGRVDAPVDRPRTMEVPRTADPEDRREP